MFVMSAPADTSDDFEEDENETELSGSSPATSAPSSAPFSLFRSSIFPSASSSPSGPSTATAGVVEGEEDEDEEDAPQLKNASSSASATATGTGSSATGSSSSKGSSSTASASEVASKGQKSAVKYSKAEKQVVDMNLAIRRAPVKKLKESFVQLRAELAPTQTALSASVRSANEAYSHSAEIDRQLSALGDRLTTLKPLFAN